MRTKQGRNIKKAQAARWSKPTAKKVVKKEVVRKDYQEEALKYIVTKLVVTKLDERMVKQTSLVQTLCFALFVAVLTTCLMFLVK
jgi:hypothetical protein